MIFNDTSKKIHIAGIGGVSMSALAEALNYKGFVVTGSDMNDGEHIERLRCIGIKISVGHRAENVDDADLVIRTAAIHDDNPEIAAALAKNIPVFERAQAWGEIMRDYKNALCISGTHGKTSTTSMCTYIALEACLDPQVMVGANLAKIGGNLRLATSDLFIAEACEYCDSFLSFVPTIAVVLNVEEDHLDYFPNIEAIIKSFRTFCELVPEDGCVIYNADDDNTCKAVEGIDRKTLSFGIDNGELRAKRIKEGEEGTSFTLFRDNEELVEINLAVHGKHNVYNALAAIASALVLGVSPKCIATGLSKYDGVSRRFELKGKYNDALIYDDYAHHPSEVRATLESVKSMGFKRIICAFQPHTFTRTRDLAEEFAKTLSIADVVYVADVFPAREKPIEGVNSELISSKIDGAGNLHSMEEIAEDIKRIASSGDIVLVMGAGDITKLSKMLCE
ncbi:MAG: UDP-N-acetylmuramate--L-alanine ligase [Clostridia bacterium]|nr:UDP-N-acetylmuramate--L-alanine ligase [Clostridia bacterium]